jgi:hypothetical protein
VICLMTAIANSGNEVTLGPYYVWLLFSIEIICECVPRALNHGCPLLSVGVDGKYVTTCQIDVASLFRPQIGL